MIGIICFWDSYATPYLQKYEKILDDMNIPYEVVFWNRTQSGKSDVQYGDGKVTISSVCRGKMTQKFIDFFRWKRLAAMVIQRQKYDRLIVLTTVPAFLLSGLLLGRYKGKYLYDIRDYTFERITVLRKHVMRIVRASVMTAISSKGYMRWLENDPKIKVNHNITVEQTAPKVTALKCKRPIRFAFVGNVRLDTQTEALMITMGRYAEIEQHFFGRILPNCPIEQIVAEQNITNIHMHGAFSVEDKQVFFQDIDLINTVYANAEKEEDIPLGDSTPLPNRLYDALVFKKPLVASRGTYLAELVDKYNLGCTVNGFDIDVVDTILQYVDSFDAESFEKGAEELKKIVIGEEKAYMTELSRILTAWKNES